MAGDCSLPRRADAADADAGPGALGPDSPTAQLAERVCLFATEPDGWALQSDVTTSPQDGVAPGGVSRLMATVSARGARRRRGRAVRAERTALWARLRARIEDLLTDFWREGALARRHRPPRPSSVRCDRSTMTQNDLDTGA